MNKFVKLIFFSSFFLAQAFMSNIQAKAPRAQSHANVYQQLLNCTFEDRLVADCSIVLSINPELKKEILEGDNSQQTKDFFIAAQQNKFATLIHQLSQDEQISLFAHWIADEIKQPKIISLTKQSLFMLTDKDGDLEADYLYAKQDDEESVTEADQVFSNRSIDPNYYDAMLTKIKSSSALKSTNTSMVLCQPYLCLISFFFLGQIAQAFLDFFGKNSDKKPEAEHSFYDLSYNELCQLLNAMNGSLNIPLNQTDNVLFNCSLKNNLKPEDLNNHKIADLLKKVEDCFHRKELEAMESDNQFDSSDSLLKAFKNQPKQEQLVILMYYFYGASLYRITSLYANALETM